MENSESASRSRGFIGHHLWRLIDCVAVNTRSTPSADALLLQAISHVDLLIFAEQDRLERRGSALSTDSSWGTFLGDSEVDAVALQTEAGDVGGAQGTGPARLAGAAEASRERLARGLEAEIERSAAGEEASALAVLANAFDLELVDLELLMLALTPDINARYQRIFGVLGDDFSATWLSPSLAAQIVAADRAERVRIGAHFSPDAPLLRHGLIRLSAVPGANTARASLPIDVAPRIARWLLQGEATDPFLQPWAWIESADSRAAARARKPVAAAVDALLGALSAHDESPVVQVKAGGRRDLLEAARYLASRLKAPLLVADLDGSETLSVDPNQRCASLVREARLLGAVLLLLPIRDIDLGGDALAPLLVAARSLGQPLLIEGEVSLAAKSIPGSGRWLSLSLPALSFSERQRLWSDALVTLRKTAGGGRKATARYKSLDAAQLARRYRFSPGQMQQVIEAASDRAMSRGERSPEAEDVLVACTETFLPSAGPLAETVQVRRNWEDLILPPDTHALLLEIVAHVERREEVLESVGGARSQAGDRGVKALFSGPPGTGKTLAAEVLAGALGYPLLRVDLSSVVSKWVGETEKLLSRLFDAAEQAPCLLLFDEADALFGSRSDVKDAQDRFANLEVSYLLQRLESFQGVAVLTTNIKRNIDEAFLRRFTAVVEFPFPEAPERLRIWQRVLPTAFPLSSEIFLPAVAEEFKLAGANIWNIAVAAGVAASSSSCTEITRPVLAHAIKREYQKLGRKLTALRPQLLSSAQEAEAERPGKRLRSNALSAAAARRRNLSVAEAAEEVAAAAAGEGSTLPAPVESSRAKPTA